MAAGCCGPTRGGPAADKAAHGTTATTASVGPTTTKGMVRLDGGPFLMGDDGPLANPFDGEGPVREVEVGPFWIDEVAVTNRRFARFAKETGHVTDAEREGWSFVFHLLLDEGTRRATWDRRVVGAAWWHAVPGADWRHPEGPGSDIGKRAEHPVVHVSNRDACAYAAWAGKRLPTEAEWEYAARGGLEQQPYPWGDELTPRGRWRCNIWQGRFPVENLAEDGHVGTAPVRSYAPNGHGLYEATGNVWEWTSTPWDVPGPDGQAVDGHLVRKGGSYLCHDSYCNRYRCSARDHNAPGDSTGNIGFRCAADA